MWPNAALTGPPPPAYVRKNTHRRVRLNAGLGFKRPKSCCTLELLFVWDIGLIVADISQERADGQSLRLSKAPKPFVEVIWIFVGQIEYREHKYIAIGIIEHIDHVRRQVVLQGDRTKQW